MGDPDGRTEKIRDLPRAQDPTSVRPSVRSSPGVILPSTRPEPPAPRVVHAPPPSPAPELATPPKTRPLPTHFSRAKSSSAAWKHWSGRSRNAKARRYSWRDACRSVHIETDIFADLEEVDCSEFRLKQAAATRSPPCIVGSSKERDGVFSVAESATLR